MVVGSAPNFNVRLPWFRVHSVILNDPGRLLSVHIVHTSLVSGWSSTMLIYELIIVDPSDTVFNPIWRQGLYSAEFTTRLGVVSSIFNWSLGTDSSSTSDWSYELVSASHLVLSGLLLLGGLWHWSYWDLDLFICNTTGLLLIDLPKVFGIHLLLASILCYGYGYFHVSGLFGPGIWSSDSYGLVGSSRAIKPVYSLVSISSARYGVIVSHHIIAGVVGFLVSLFHISSRPQVLLFQLLRMNNIESVLSSSVIVVGFASVINAGLLWYGGVVSPIELYGPTRYHWDSSYFSQELNRRSRSSSLAPGSASNKSPSSSDVGSSLGEARFSDWTNINDKLFIYDYIGSNPSKGGIFRSGACVKGDGILVSWLGHPSFVLGSLALSVRRIPPFFETFPLLLIDQRGRLRGDIPFRRAQSLYSIDQLSNISVSFSGGLLDGKSYSRPSLVKAYALKAQFGEIFSFDKNSASSDGVFRTTIRGWYSFSHLSLGLIFLFGHLWHGGRSLFQDLTAGITIEVIQDVVEYGINEKMGDTN
jgi:photosystem II CP47 chlorophyll apoprotein